jgi:hypothetical protein
MMMMNKAMLRVSLACLALATGLRAGSPTSNDLLLAMPLSENLEMVMPDGSRKLAAKFTRQSQASMQDFARVERDVPRFYTQAKTKGLLIENGSNNWKHAARGSNNALLPETASCETLEGFTVIGKAKSNLVAGLQGKHALEFVSSSDDAGIETIPVDLLTPEPQLASFYLKSATPAKLSVTVKATSDQGTKVVAQQTFQTTGEWTRQFVTFKSGLAKNGKGKVQLTLSTAIGKPVTIDALMLEQCGIYMGRFEPSSWIPGGSNRASETLLVPLAENKLEAGAISFNVVPTALGGWNCLFCAGTGWKPAVMISLKRNGTRLEAAIFGKTLRQDLKFQSGKGYRITLNWGDGQAALYCNGAKLTETSFDAVQPLGTTVSLGGSPDSTSPNIKADGIFSDFSIWKRRLTDAEIKNLGHSLATLLKLTNGLTSLTPCNVFARDMASARIVWSVKKKTRQRL